jgi:GrpB-like predicted nucleotidyltransferase (UPF0157 family)
MPAKRRNLLRLFCGVRIQDCCRAAPGHPPLAFGWTPLTATTRIPRFTALVSLSNRGWNTLLLPTHPGPKDGGDVLPYVKIVEYDSRWPAVYEVEKQRILQLAGSRIAAIEHFGSTSIPRICAKPVIDILVGLVDWKEAKGVRRLLSAFDYRYIAGLEEDWHVLGRTGSPAFRVHLVPYQSFRWTGHLALRDYLRSHPRVAFAYCRLKKQMAITHLTQRVKYSQAKREFLDNIEDLARKGILASRLVSPRGPG